MKPSLDALDELLLGPVRRGKTAPAAPWRKRRRPTIAENLQRIARVTARTPEVMVRISGKAKGAKHVEAHLRYITRNGELVAEDECGQLVIGRRMVKETASAWMEGSALNRRRNSRDTVNLVLSMPVGTDREKLHDAARLFGQRTFGGSYSYLLARHDDTDHPHCHLTVRSLGFDGRRLNPMRADLQAWRELFAEACREMGIAAEATPRRVRGVVKKAQRQAIRHADRDKKTGPRSTVQKSKAREALAAAMQAETDQVHPWDQAIQSQRAAVDNAWTSTATALEDTKSEAGLALAKQVRQFARTLPPLETERHELQRKACALLDDRNTQRRPADHGQDLTTRDQHGAER